ncbi:MAG: subtilisin family serine protease [Pseudohongiellaceae bacterium]|jgi:subtilisin family serine protease
MLLSFLFAMSWAPVGQAQSPSLLKASSRPAAIDTDLFEAMVEAAPGEQIDVYLVLSEQLSPSQLRQGDTDVSPRERRKGIAQRLAAHADETQAGLRAQLDQAAAAGQATFRDVLWMGNAMLFSAEPALLSALASQTGVDRIRRVRPVTPEQVQDLDPTAPYPFFDNFEGGFLQPVWQVATSGNGYASVRSDGDPLGQFHLVMASSVDLVDSTASITLEFDLSGMTDVGVRFQQKEYGDEDHTEDGVYISDDGVNFFKVIDLIGGPEDYAPQWLTLDGPVAALGLEFNNTFFVRFQWRDNFDIPTDGMAFDEIEIGPGVGVEPTALPEPNLVAMGAPKLWALGFDGSGVTIGSIDSGVLKSHPDLAGSFWNNPNEIPGNGIDDDGNTYIDDIWGWDFENGDADPQSTDPHGTQSAGLIVGDGSSGKITGMAPGATLVNCQVGTAADYWLAQQYLLLIGADVITSSYSYKWPDQPDYHMFRQLCDVELAAGIIHANSIGNQGNQQGSHPIPFNISAPGNVPSPFGHPAAENGGRSSVIACGGVNSDNTLYGPSGQGPSAWEDITLYAPSYPHFQDNKLWDYPVGGFGGSLPGLLKPDVVTYTNTVLTTNLSSGYGPFSGTSAATPQLGGALTMLRQIQPDAEPRHLAAAVELTALDLGPAGKDTNFGAGRLDAYAAGRRLVVLAKAVPNEVSIGSTFVLQLHGQPNTLTFGFLSTGLVTNAGSWNLDLPFVALPVVPLNPSGRANLPLTIPSDPSFIGLTVWTQYAQPLATTDWGLGHLFSVPEPISFVP